MPVTSLASKMNMSAVEVCKSDRQGRALGTAVPSRPADLGVMVSHLSLSFQNLLPMAR